MKNSQYCVESRMINSKVSDDKIQPFYFIPKQNRFSTQKKLTKQRNDSSGQKDYYCGTQIKQLVHKWTQFQESLKNKHNSNQNFQILVGGQENPYFSSGTEHQNKQNPLIESIINYLYAHHKIFKRINFNLVETLVNVGTFSIHAKNQEIPYIFYDEKHKNKCNQRKKLGIILYGKLKLYNKIDSFEKILNQNQSIGQHGLDTLYINFPDYRNIKIKCIQEQTGILWIKKQHYQILFKESMKCGLRQQMKKLQSHLKMCWIKKSIKKS